MPDNVVRLRNYGGRMLKFVNRQRLRSFIAFTVQNNIIMDSLFFLDSGAEPPDQIIETLTCICSVLSKKFNSCVDVILLLRTIVMFNNKSGFDISIPRRQNFENWQHDDRLIEFYIKFYTITQFLKPCHIYISVLTYVKHDGWIVCLTVSAVILESTVLISFRSSASDILHHFVFFTFLTFVTKTLPGVSTIYVNKETHTTRD